MEHDFIVITSNNRTGNRQKLWFDLNRNVTVAPSQFIEVSYVYQPLHPINYIRAVIII